MAGSQITTSVTIINSLLGFEGVSISGFDTTSAPTVLAGSKLEVASAFFTWDSIETPNASSWTAIATATNCYIGFAPSGTAGSQIVTAGYYDDAVWSTSKQGWYTSVASNIRCLFSVYKASDVLYRDKTKLADANKAVHGKLGIIDDRQTFSRIDAQTVNIPIGTNNLGTLRSNIIGNFEDGASLSCIATGGIVYYDTTYTNIINLSYLQINGATVTLWGLISSYTTSTGALSTTGSSYVEIAGADARITNGVISW